MEQKGEQDEISVREGEGKRVFELYRLTTKKDTPKPKRLGFPILNTLPMYNFLNMLSLSLSLALTFSHLINAKTTHSLGKCYKHL